jgi:hypothetical protein
MAVLFLSFGLAFSQTKTGTLKIFTEIHGVTVFLDEKRQDNFEEIAKIPAGTHYLRVSDSDGIKIFGQVVTINENQVTTVLVEAPKTNAQVQAKTEDKTVEKPLKTEPVVQTQQDKTGTVKIFSELTGIVIYLDEIKQGDNILQINNVPIGSHYLKVLKDGVSILGELISVTENTVTTILVKNDGQVAEKIMDSKVKEREEYNNSKIDVLFASNTVTTTKGSNTLFPGYYGYYGYSNSVSNSSQVADFKIIQGGVKEISDVSLATLAGNQGILNRNAADNLKQTRMASTGGLLFLGSFLIGGTLFADMLVKKPFLHKVGTTASNFEVGAAAVCVVGCTIGYVVVMGSDKIRPAHYYQVEDASKDGQDYNRKLKQKLGLPESYDLNK